LSGSPSLEQHELFPDDIKLQRLSVVKFLGKSSDSSNVRPEFVFGKEKAPHSLAIQFETLANQKQVFLRECEDKDPVLAMIICFFRLSEKFVLCFLFFK
jgi:hypothetical protein